MVASKESTIDKMAEEFAKLGFVTEEDAAKRGIVPAESGEETPRGLAASPGRYASSIQNNHTPQSPNLKGSKGKVASPGRKIKKEKETTSDYF